MYPGATGKEKEDAFEDLCCALIQQCEVENFKGTGKGPDSGKDAEFELRETKIQGIPNDFKLNTIDLVETTNEQIKNNKPCKGIISSLSEKIKLITTADSTIKASGNLVQYANQLWALLKPFILN